MTIAEVSRKYDITADTLRYYERIGLIPNVPRTKSGIRDYDEESCRWIELMKCMRKAGVQIEALIEYERLDGKVVLVPCCDVVRHNGSELVEQRAYLDQTAIFADLSSGEHVYKDHWIDDIPAARAALNLAPEPEFL